MWHNEDIGIDWFIQYSTKSELTLNTLLYDGHTGNETHVRLHQKLNYPLSIPLLWRLRHQAIDLAMLSIYRLVARLAGARRYNLQCFPSREQQVGTHGYSEKYVFMYSVTIDKHNTLFSNVSISIYIICLPVPIFSLHFSSCHSRCIFLSSAILSSACICVPSLLKSRLILVPQC